MISVIMSVYQEPVSYVEKSVDSILNQTVQDIEFIIIVDDPNNKKVIQYLQMCIEKDKRIKFYINEKNCGLTESLNRAIRYSKGEYVARMDADDISELDRLEIELKSLVENNLDIVGCNIQNIDEKGNIISKKGSQYPSSDRAIKEYLRTNSALAHPTWLVKRSVYEEYMKIGPYLEFPACEDYEFLTRIALDGKKLGNIKEVKLKYRINREGISSTKKVKQKLSHFFVNRCYKQGQKSNLEEFLEFVNESGGIRKKRSLTEYYRKSAMI